MKILVTGANGFLGRHVVEELLRRGHSVRVLVRPACRLAHQRWLCKVEVLRGDLRTAENLADAFDGIDALVHLAAAVSGPDDEIFASTVTGTERLLKSMAQSKTRRIILASSFSVYSWENITHNLDENSPVEHAPALYSRDGYTVAKVWQERVTRQQAEENKWDLTVVRPGFIWGRGSEYFAALGVRIGQLHCVIGPRTRLPITYVSNCADLFGAVVDNPRSIGQTFNVIDGDDVRIWEHLHEHLTRTGKGGIRVPVPYHVGLAMVESLHWLIERTLRGRSRLPGILVPCRFQARFKPLRFSSMKARVLLGWTPPLNWKECLDRTYERPLQPVAVDNTGPAPLTNLNLSE
jgi:UDP-glucose 4-epimerase